eukprot:jgi/Picre1/35707/NNA_003167.t1
MKRVKDVLRNHVREWKEIILPSPLPNPPEYVPPTRKSLTASFGDIRKGFSMYLDTWKTKPEDKAKEEAMMREFVEESNRAIEEAKGVSHKGKDIASTLLKNQYAVRIKAYQMAIKEFIKGYKEGVQEGGQNP